MCSLLLIMIILIFNWLFFTPKRSSGNATGGVGVETGATRKDSITSRGRTDRFLMGAETLGYFEPGGPSSLGNELEREAAPKDRVCMIMRVRRVIVILFN